MKILLYYLTMIILILLIILISVYVTSVYNNGYPTCKDIRKIINTKKLNEKIDNVYDFKVSKEFEKMFNQDLILTTYEAIDANINNIAKNI